MSITNKRNYQKKLTKEQRLLLNLIGEMSSKYSNKLKHYFIETNSIEKRKIKKRKRFLEKKRRKYFGNTERLKLGPLPQMISQAITKGIPLREPKRKKNSQPELSPLLYENILKSDRLKKTIIDKHSDNPETKSINIEYVPDTIYFQRVDDDNSKMLVKMIVSWGYLEKNRLPLFLDEDNNEKAECTIIVFNEQKEYIGSFPLIHAAKLQNDDEGSANALFVGLMTDLKPDTFYFYRIECKDKESEVVFACTNPTKFKTSFNLNEANKPLFMTIGSDLHGGRKGSFLRGKVTGQKTTGNLALAKVFNNIAATEDEVTFNHGYSLAIATGDLTENASYSEYWVDLFKRSSVLYDHVPLLTCIGNHDYYCGGRGRGNMTGGSEEDCRYWHRFITNPNSSSGNLPGHWYSIDQGNAHLIFLDTNGTGWGKYDINCGSEQWLWLENDLKEWRNRLLEDENAPQFCFVFIHSAIMSLGFWGRGFNFGNDEKVQSYLTPLFRKYGVDIVFSGHDHIYQRSNWLGTTYLQNGRHGGTTRPYLFWKMKRAVYTIDNICKNTRTRIYPTIYVPPNYENLSDKEEKDFLQFKNQIRDLLLKQKTSENYFFGLRSINQEIGALFDRYRTLKERLIDEFIIPKLDTHIWLRSYAVEDEYHTGYREIVDMMFLPYQVIAKEKLKDDGLNCPERVVE